MSAEAWPWRLLCRRRAQLDLRRSTLGSLDFGRMRCSSDGRGSVFLTLLMVLNLRSLVGGLNGVVYRNILRWDCVAEEELGVQRNLVVLSVSILIQRWWRLVCSLLCIGRRVECEVRRESRMLEEIRYPFREFG